ncbi:MAG TPA: TM0106 family RecB-like putative nuclease, partial [Agitococcus sp.]|nr:TM0106 family RecB-like putative nuclease [Agitococcus sp.]
MQKRHDGQYLYSPSDLVTYVESPFASIMDRLVCEGEIANTLKNKANEDAAAQLVIQRGFNHEDKQTQKFKDEGKRVLEIDHKAPDKQQKTLDAMQQGYEVIVQAYLVHESFAGFADFLVKVQGQSKLGDYYYEVWDTKLAHSAKPAYLIQLCCYAEMLKKIQGILPAYLTIALGNDKKERIKTIDCFAYYQAIKKAFLQQQQHLDVNHKPDPANYKDWGQWSQYAQNVLTEKDHVFYVANITYRQIQKLQAANINTMLALAESPLESVKDIVPSVFERLKKQAQLQKQSTEESVPKFEILTQADNVAKGLALLPTASPLDIFFDIEGFPHEQDGLEYLWGVTYFDENNQRCFKAYWAHDREQEKQAFESLKWAYARWQQDNTMHIYHYAPYEVTACRKLMGRFGVCEQEVDDLLRRGVFVDLYKIVKSGLLVGTPNYSIKSIERLYGSEHQGEVANGGDSIVAYENYRNKLANGEIAQANTILKNIEAYNKDDCDSTQELTAWLRQLQKEKGISYQTSIINVEQKELTDEQRAVLALRDRLLTQAESLKQDNAIFANQLANIAWMLEFHRREDKPKWWKYFDRMDATEEELWDDLDCLAMCQRTEREAFQPMPQAINLAYEYRFDVNQDFKGGKEDFIVLGLTTNNGTDVKVKLLKEESSLKKGVITLKSSQVLPQVITLIPNDYINPQPIPTALQQVIEAISTHGNTTHCAIQHFLAKQPPKIAGHTGGVIVNAANS